MNDSSHLYHLKFAKTIGLFALFFLSSVGEPYANDQIVAIQEKLKAKGFYAGEVDGRHDNETAASIARYQIRSGLEVTGEPNKETLESLGIAPSEPVLPSAKDHQRIEAWKVLREQDQQFLKQTTPSGSNEPIQEQTFASTSIEQIRDFIAGFVVAGISPDVEAELQFYAEKADYYDSGLVSKDFIRRDILRYDQKWPIRRYWLDGDVDVLTAMDANPMEVRFNIKYIVQNQSKESRGNAMKILKLQKTPRGLEIISVREKTWK